MEASNLGRRRLRWIRARRARQRAAAMTVVEHLEELRSRLIVSLLAFVAVSVVAFAAFSPILEILRRPLCSIDPELLGPQGCDLFYTGAMGGVQVRLKVTALTGIIFSSPVWLYQIWAFVSPGLTHKEKRYAIPFVASSVTLFAAGLAFAWYTLPKGLNFLILLSGEDLVPLFRAEEYLSFVGLVLVAFGISFELPLLLFFLGLAGAISVEQLRKGRRIALVVIVTIAAVVTPSQDPYTMLAMAAPLYLLYELTTALLALVMKRRRKKEASGRSI